MLSFVWLGLFFVAGAECVHEQPKLLSLVPESPQELPAVVEELHKFPENCLAGLAGPAHWHQGQQRHSAQCKTAGGVPRGKASPRCHVGMQLCYMEFLLGLRETVQGGPLLTTEPFGMLCGGFLVRHARKGNSCKLLAL